MTARISARPRGPLVIEGDIELTDMQGNRVDVSGRKKILLCRCGASRTRPLCDGSHNRIGFEAPDEP
jgi:CDGSH-type Zn-finger protein